MGTQNKDKEKQAAYERYKNKRAMRWEKNKLKREQKQLRMKKEIEQSKNSRQSNRNQPLSSQYVNDIESPSRSTSINLRFTDLSNLRMQRRHYKDFIKLCPFTTDIHSLIIDFVCGSLDQETNKYADSHKFYRALREFDAENKKHTIAIPKSADDDFSQETRKAITEIFNSKNDSIELYSLWHQRIHQGSSYQRSKKMLFVGQIKFMKIPYPKYVYFALEMSELKKRHIQNRSVERSFQYIDFRLSKSIDKITTIVQGDILRKFYPEIEDSGESTSDESDDNDDSF